MKTEWIAKWRELIENQSLAIDDIEGYLEKKPLTDEAKEMFRTSFINGTNVYNELIDVLERIIRS